MEKWPSKNLYIFVAKRQIFASIFELRKILESVTGVAKENVDHQVDMIRPYDKKKISS